MSNGRLMIKAYAAGEIVPALEVFSAVSSGTAEMGHGAAYYWKGKIPAAPLFTSVPFGLNAQEMNGWLHYGGGLAYGELYAPFNLVPMAAGNTGIQMGGWYNKELSTIDDFKGLRMRIPGLGGEVFTRAGGTAVNLAAEKLHLQCKPVLSMPLSGLRLTMILPLGFKTLPNIITTRLARARADY